MDTLPCVDAYVQSWFDYGAFRKTVRGFGIHMAEGGGTVGYLDNKGTAPARGVSVHFVIEYTGRIVQMLPLNHASGAFNPDDRSTEKPFYGPGVLKRVLGDDWYDPNAVSITVEIEGFAKDGPNDKQIASLKTLYAQLRAHVPTMVGAFGHADQTDTKACPGTSLKMLTAWDTIGGHGVFNMTPVTVSDTTPKLVSAVAGPRYDLDGKTILVQGIAFPDRIAAYRANNGMYAVFLTIRGIRRLALVKPTTIKDVPPTTSVPDPATLAAEFNKGVDAAVNAAATARK